MLFLIAEFFIITEDLAGGKGHFFGEIDRHIC